MSRPIPANEPPPPGARARWVKRGDRWHCLRHGLVECDACATSESLPSTPDRELASNDLLLRARRSGECVMCGSSPATFVTLRQGMGMLFMRRTRGRAAELCRDCGLAEFREMQNATLILGWWGVISFFTNFWFVFGNWGAALKLRKLGTPTRTELIDVPFLRPLPPGRPLYARSGVWVAAAITVVGSYLLATAASSSSASGPSWEVGSCVRGTTKVHPVSCSDSHDGKIVATSTAASGCPGNADGYADDGAGTTYCIDTSQ